MREKFFRARIQPVNILDDEEDERRLARAKEQVAERAEGPLLELSAADAIEKLRRGGHPKEVRDQDPPVFSFQAQILEPLTDAFADFLPADPLGETEVSPHEFRNWTVGHRAVIGRARRFQFDDSSPIEGPEELVEQPGLADTGVALDQHDGTVPSVGPVIGLGQTPQLVVPADQWRQPALLGNLEPGSATDLADQRVSPNRLGLPFDLELAQVLEHEESVRQVLSPPADDDLPRLRETQKPGREVCGITHSRVVHAKVFADGTDDDTAGIDAHPHTELEPVGSPHIVLERLQALLDRQGDRKSTRLNSSH